MKPNLLYSVFIVFVFVLFVSGCGASSPTPIVNPPAVDTSLASTARALAKQTETANHFTVTPSLTFTPTLTPTPKISMQGTSLTVWEDQTALFIDQKAGIYLVIPAGWMPIRASEDEYYNAFTSEVVLANPELSDRLTQLQNIDLDRFRLDAMDIREGHIHNGVISDMNVVFYLGDTRGLDEWAQDYRKRKSPLKNYWIINMGYPKRDDGTRVLMVEDSWSKDQSNKIYHRAVFLSLPSGTLQLDLFTHKDFKDMVLADFEKVVNSVKLLEQ